MKDVNGKKSSLVLVEGIIVILLTSLFFSLGFGFYLKDVLFVEGLVISIIGILSIMGNRANDLWINVDYNGLTTVNEDIKIMEKESRALLKSFGIEMSSAIIIILGIVSVIISYII